MRANASNFAPKLDRQTALSTVFQMLVSAGEEALSRDSECWLKHAASAVANAINAENRGAA